MTDVTSQIQAEELTPDEIEQRTKEWMRDAYQKAVGFLAQKSIVTESVADSESRYLPPLFAVWKLKSNEQNWYWAISGDLPTDYLDSSAAKNAREAIRVFSMRWQLQAESIRQTAQGDSNKIKFANMLEMRAENIYGTFENENLWANDPSNKL